MPKARLIDVSKCTACRGCQVACKQWNELPAEHTTQRGTYENPPELSGSTWIKVEFRERPEEWLFRAHTCMHCTDASCEKVCPTGAISHQGEMVIIDQQGRILFQKFGGFDPTEAEALIEKLLEEGGI